MANGGRLSVHRQCCRNELQGISKPQSRGPKAPSRGSWHRRKAMTEGVPLASPRGEAPAAAGDEVELRCRQATNPLCCSPPHPTSLTLGHLPLKGKAWFVPFGVVRACNRFSYCTLSAFPFGLRGLFDGSEIRQRRHGAFFGLRPGAASRAPASGGEGPPRPLPSPVRGNRPLTRFYSSTGTHLMCSSSSCFCST